MAAIHIQSQPSILIGNDMILDSHRGFHQEQFTRSIIFAWKQWESDKKTIRVKYFFLILWLEMKVVSIFPAAKHNTAWKVSKYGVISGPYFPVFGLNTEIYFVLRYSIFYISDHSINFESCGVINTRGRVHFWNDLLDHKPFTWSWNLASL